MSDAQPKPAVEPQAAPVTGHAEIDAALAALVRGDDVHTHPDAIAAALDVVQGALHPRQPPSPQD